MLNFDKLFDVYPEARNMSGTILALIKMVPKIDDIIKQGMDLMGEVEMGDGKEYGHRVVSTKKDRELQRLILNCLSQGFPESFFITEEKVENHQFRVVCEEELSSLHEYALVWGVDPLDGSAHFWHGLWEWSISVGVMERGVHRGGMIYGPRVNGGVCVIGEREKGVFLIEDGGDTVQRVRTSTLAFSESVLFVGVDFAWNSAFNNFINEAAKEAFVTRAVGSCALGLASVAAGKVGAFVQPVQKSWDWFAGFPLVEEAGGKFQFYHYRDGSSIMLLDKPDDLAYISSNPDVGFIAGNPEMVRKLTDLLVQNYSI